MSTSSFFQTGGATGPQRFTRAQGRSMFGDGTTTVRYPNPFFDIAQTFVPSSFRSMFAWCRFLFITHPLINSAVWKLSAYPVTDLLIESSEETWKKKWTHFLKRTLRFKRFRVELGLDYHTYGNAYVSIYFPFVKFLTCPACEHAVEARRQKYRFRNFEFHGECQKCSASVKFTPVDRYVKSSRDIRLIRWNPEQITVQYNEVSGERRHYLSVSGQLSSDIQLGKRHAVEGVPQVFIEAVRKKKAVLLSPDNIYHMRRPTLAQKDQGLGMSAIIPVMKDTYLLQTMKKAQEAILVERIVPLNVLFPQVASGSADAYATVNLDKWRSTVEREIQRWRLDPNYIPVLPLPIGHQTIGGDGRALMLSQEYRVQAEQVVSGFGVPIEFIFGGLSFSGSNVSLRMLENQFLDDISDHMDILEWVIERTAAFMEWTPVSARFHRFKMADDLQRSAFFMQLNQAGKLSDDSLLEETGWDPIRERGLIRRNQDETAVTQKRQMLDQARMQGESMLAGQRYQMRAEQLTRQAQAPIGPLASEVSPLSVDSPGSAETAAGLETTVESLVAKLDQLPEHERAPTLERIRTTMPQLHSVILQALQSRAGAHQTSAAKPQPLLRPPRRGPESTT